VNKQETLEKIAAGSGALRQFENPDRIRMLVNSLKESIGHPKQYVSISTKTSIKRNVKKKVKNKNSLSLKGDQMYKQSALERVYNLALEDELEKIAMVNPAILKQFENPSIGKKMLNVIERAAYKSKNYAGETGKKGKNIIKKIWTPYEVDPSSALWRTGKDISGKGKTDVQILKRNKLRNLLVRTGLIGTPIAATAGAVIPSSIHSHNKKKKQG